MHDVISHFEENLSKMHFLNNEQCAMLVGSSIQHHAKMGNQGMICNLVVTLC